MRLLAAFILSFVTAVSGVAAPARAQEGGPKTILVLDASGSMWGQIEGRAKITIAQEVVARLLGEIGPDRVLGLTAYGHRRKGDCGDIETLVPPAAGTADEILAAVNAIKPKGKTPLSAAVLAAAEALKFEEEPATVVLVSDGRETCDLDPCEVGRRLEETGVGFTAHVVGFDVAEEADRAQLRCLAENTGGRFLTASSAKELTEALAEVSVAAPEPEPAPAPEPEPKPALTDMIFLATEGEGGPQVRRGLVWTLSQVGGQTVVETMEVADLRMALPPGDYRVEVLRTDDEQTVERTLTVARGAPQTVALPLEDLTPPASVAGPAEAVAGSTVQVAWEGPELQNDYIAVAAPGEEGARSVNLVRVRDGNPAVLVMPPEPGEYELRYVLYDGREVLARQPVTVTEVAATLEAPAEAVAGATVQVGWQGPDYANDFIAVAGPDQDGGQSVNFARTRDGEPAALVMPAEPGDYEIRYVMYQDRTVLARRAVTVTEVAATVDAPAEAEAGSTVQVGWEGPDYPNDFISVASPEQDGGQSVNFARTRDGSPLALVMPAEPGDYEIRYVQYQDRVVLARQPVTVTGVAASLTAPGEADAGATVQVAWTGPDYASDFISVVEPGAQGGAHINYTYTREGSPLALAMPPEPGEYEIRYVQYQDRTVLASQPVTVTEVGASLTAPGEAAAGATVQVGWSGPDYASDFISVVEPGAQGGAHINYTYTREGSPLALEMPPEPGEYEIRYVQYQGRTVLARRPVTVTDVTASLTAPGEAAAGATVQVGWSGPDYASDFISVVEPGAPGGAHISYTYTREGSPLALAMPAEPGDYEIRYVQYQGRTVLASQPVTVTDVTASLEAPAEAQAGSTILVTWSGPDYDRDFVSVALPDDPDGRHRAYTYTREGSPLRLTVPEEPGTYELRYVQGQGKRALARRALTVTDATATLETAATAKPGTRLRVDWTGPAGPRDMIAVARPGDQDRKRASQTPADRSPLMVELPDEPGEWEVRYLLNGTRAIARHPVTLE